MKFVLCVNIFQSIVYMKKEDIYGFNMLKLNDAVFMWYVTMWQILHVFDCCCYVLNVFMYVYTINFFIDIGLNIFVLQSTIWTRYALSLYLVIRYKRKAFLF